jgi:hypothetical protein
MKRTTALFYEPLNQASLAAPQKIFEQAQTSWVEAFNFENWRLFTIHC